MHNCIDHNWNRNEIGQFVCRGCGMPVTRAAVQLEYILMHERHYPPCVGTPECQCYTCNKEALGKAEQAEDGGFCHKCNTWHYGGVSCNCEEEEHDE